MNKKIRLIALVGTLALLGSAVACAQVLSPYNTSPGKPPSGNVYVRPMERNIDAQNPPATTYNPKAALPESGAPAVSPGWSGDLDQSDDDVITIENPHPSSSPTIPPHMGQTECSYQYLIGKNIKDVDLSKIKKRVRVLYPNTPITFEYSPDRLNITLERGTDIILQVTCG